MNAHIIAIVFIHFKYKKTQNKHNKIKVFK